VEEDHGAAALATAVEEDRAAQPWQLLRGDVTEIKFLSSV